MNDNQKIICPRCSRPISVREVDHAVEYVCPNCGVIDQDEFEIQKRLRDLSQTKGEGMIIVMLANIKELLRKTSTWHECHWSKAGTDEGAEKYFKGRGLKTEGVTVYRLPFGYCYPVEAV
jgi:predicted RNA-binding Zn-ribbon protein involved in translation (DUF1610 family)